ncbi:hypothetical protein E2C01_047729 [Portunus trituberculatus]|uniref:Uncharacterized protein n=1 Tax=Portunus trituberculatus TaxID=210409 RepID=A0A5B7G9L9_PORTR|nr:hypothetical protein [Portunus trituberculatus]
MPCFGRVDMAISRVSSPPPTRSRREVEEGGAAPWWKGDPIGRQSDKISSLLTGETLLKTALIISVALENSRAWYRGEKQEHGRIITAPPTVSLYGSRA